MGGPSAIFSVILFVLTACCSASAQIERQELGNRVIEGIPEVPERIVERLRQYQSIRSASLVGWLPDGDGILIGTRFGETTQIHQVARPGGARRQITFFDEPIRSARVSPVPRRNGFVFARDVGGSEFYQLFYYDLDDAEYRMLTDGRSRNDDAVWSHAGDRIAFQTTHRNGRDWDIYVYDLDGASSSCVLEASGSWSPIDWSPDDSRLLLENYVSINESYLHVLDLDDGELHALHRSDSNVSYGRGEFNADGTGIYYTSDEDSEFRRLRFRNLATDETTVLTGDIDWDIESFKLSHDGRLLAFTANEEGYNTLYLMNTADGTRTSLPPLPHGVIGGLEFSPDGTQLGITVGSPAISGDVFSLDLTTNEVTRWTMSETGGFSEDAFVEPTLIRFETFDEVNGAPRTIPAFYYRPAGDGPFPVVLDIHGGPESQERPTFNPWIQYLVGELGVAVLAPNVRGSAGYGKSYLLLDNGERREDTVKDIGALLDWVAAQPELNADRVAVYGGSYGGFMVLSSMTHYNDRLRAGIDIVGISNFVTFLENTQDYRRDRRRAEYGDERDPAMREFLTRISPRTNSDRITIPLFVAQGLNDPRVPASESEAMVAEIRDNGGDVWYLLFKDEGHGFAKKSNRDYFTQVAALFLETHLVGAPSRGAGE